MGGNTPKNADALVLELATKEGKEAKEFKMLRPLKGPKDKDVWNVSCWRCLEGSCQKE